MISALERLRALRAGNRPDDGIIGPDRLPMEWRIEYEERAGILEYDGGLSREDADKQALEEILERIKNDD